MAEAEKLVAKIMSENKELFSDILKNVLDKAVGDPEFAERLLKFGRSVDEVSDDKQ